MTTAERNPSGQGRLPRFVPRRLHRWWWNTPVRWRFMTVAMAALLVSLPTIGLMVALELRHAELRADVRSTEHLVDDMRQLEESAYAASGGVLFYTITLFEDDQYLDEFQRAATEASNLVARLEQEVPPEFDQQMGDVSAALDTQLSELGALADFGGEIAGEPIEGEIEETLFNLYIGVIVSSGEMRELTLDLHADLDERLVSERARVSRLESMAIQAVLASWFVTFVAITGGAIFVTTDVARRVTRLTENGRRFVQERPLLPVRESDDEIGQLTGTMMSLAGVLDQRRQEAVAATRTRDAFLTRISHELRPPLAEIRELGQVLAENQDLSTDDRDAARHIVKGGDHLLTLIHDLLDISRIETGNLSIATRAVPLREVIEEAVALSRQRAEGRSITIATDCPPDLVVFADRQRLIQVLLNLLSNAVKYNRSGGHVDITATPQDGTLRISVADTGPGISPEGQERLFRPFERLGAEKTGVEGSGIGLALTRHLVDAMGGAIEVESQTGQGSTFSVYLPEVDPAADAKASPLPEVPEPSDELQGGPDSPEGHPVVLPEVAEAAFHNGLEREARLDSRTAVGRVRQRWRGIGMRKKVLAVAAAALILAGPAASLAIYRTNALNEARADAQSTEDLVSDLNTLEDISFEATDAVLFFIITFEDQFLADFQALRSDATDLVTRLEQMLPAELRPTMRQTGAALDEQLDELSTVAASVAELAEEPTGEDLAPEEMLLDATVAELEFREQTADLGGRLDQQLATDRQEVTNLENGVTRTVLSAWLITVVTVATGTTLVVTNMVRRVERLAENGQRFIHGRPLLPLHQADDEIGRLTTGSIVVGGALVQRRKEADEATRLRDEFLSRISHEMRTPLTAIIGFGEILEDEELAPDAHEAARQIVRGGQHLLTLIDDLLDLSKLETGHLSIVTEPVPVDEVADEAVALVRPRATGRSITVTTSYPRNLVAKANRQRLQQVLLSLLSNAVQYNQPSGHVDVAATFQDGTVRISVSDTGPGLSPEDQAILFRPFEPLGTGRTGAEGDDAPGRGIGLALTQHLVNAMNGTISVDSQAGQGSTFHVDLPAGGAETGTAPADGYDRTARIRKDPEPALVLYADTNPADIARIEETFKDRPERLQTMPDGHAIPNLVRLLEPCLLVLATDLPDVDTEALLLQIKRATDTAPLPVIILASDPTPEEVQHLRACGAHTVLSRPIDPTRLVEALENI